MGTPGEPRRRASASVAVWMAVGSLGLLAAVAACGTFLDLGDPYTPGPDTNDDGSTVLPERLDAADFPEGSTILDDGGVQLPDGAVVDGTAADSADATPTDDQLVPPGCPGVAACDRVVFVSSQVVKMSDVAIAAETCTTLAANATLLSVKGRKFDAWVSTSVSSAESRLVHGTRPYKTSTGKVIANNWNDLTDGVLANALFHNENGGGTGGGARVWTATSPAGAYAPPGCTDWTLQTDMAIKGSVGGVNGNWSDFGAAPCISSAYLYCIEK